jgi:hypothetical protein
MPVFPRDPATPLFPRDPATPLFPRDPAMPLFPRGPAMPLFFPGIRRRPFFPRAPAMPVFPGVRRCPFFPGIRLCLYSGEGALPLVDKAEFPRPGERPLPDDGWALSSADKKKLNRFNVRDMFLLTGPFTASSTD